MICAYPAFSVNLSSIYLIGRLVSRQRSIHSSPLYSASQTHSLPAACLKTAAKVLYPLYSGFGKTSVVKWCGLCTIAAAGFTQLGEQVQVLVKFCSAVPCGDYWRGCCLASLRGWYRCTDVCADETACCSACAGSYQETWGQWNHLFVAVRDSSSTFHACFFFCPPVPDGKI